MNHQNRRAGEGELPYLARASLYQFLAHCFAYPEPDLLDLIGSNVTPYVDIWTKAGLNAADEIDAMIAWRKPFTPEEALERLQIEYTRLFVNTFPRIPAPPYSAIYLTDGQRPGVWGNSTAQAVRLYEEAGLFPSGEFNDLPDHIAAELEFVSYLITQQIPPSGDEDAIRNLSRIEQSFLEDHLYLWAPAFFKRVQESTQNDFFQSAAKLAFHFIEWDRQTAPTNTEANR